MPELMLEPTPSEFLKLRGDANVVPVSCEISADLETPISAYLKLRDLPSSFLFESTEKRATWAPPSTLSKRKLEGSSRSLR